MEQHILDKYKFEIDVLKVAHHGSNTSSTNEFIKKMNAELAIISVGENNHYNLPNEQVLSRLRENQYLVYRTDVHGTITIYDIPLTKVKMIESFTMQKRKRYIVCNI